MRKSRRGPVTGSGVFVRLFVIGILPFVWSSECAAQPLKPIEKAATRRELSAPIADFSLTDQHAKPFRFHSLRGRVVLVSFVYTSCPDVCPLLTSSALSVQKRLRNEEKRSVFLLTITTDPEVDTPAVLKSYAGRFGADFSNWSFITGEPSSLAAAWKAFGVQVKRKGRGLVDHTPLTAIVDGEGNLRVVYIGSSPDPNRLLRDIRALLTSPPAGRPKS